MIIVIKDRAMLCKDKMWREFAGFGTFNSCVKVYKRRAIAERWAMSQNAILAYKNKEANVKVAELPDGYTVNAVGQVFNTEDRQVGTLQNFTTDSLAVAS